MPATIWQEISLDWTQPNNLSGLKFDFMYSQFTLLFTTILSCTRFTGSKAVSECPIKRLLLWNIGYDMLFWRSNNFIYIYGVP